MESQSKVIGIAIIILLLLLTAGGFYFNSKNKKNLNAEKLRTESLLSEKLQVQKELDKIKNDMASLLTKSQASEKELAESQASLSDKEKRIAYLSRQLSSQNKSKSEMEELQKEKAALDNSYASLKSEYDKLAAQGQDLKNSLASLEAEKNELTKKIDNAALYETDNFMAFGSRGNKKDKLTFWACRTKKLNLNFEVPQSLTEEISFRVTTPSGKVINPEDKSLTWKITQDPRNFTASLSMLSGEFESSRQVVLTYQSKEKLERGEYKIQILCKDVNIGNCRLKLK